MIDYSSAYSTSNHSIGIHQFQLSLPRPSSLEAFVLALRQMCLQLRDTHLGTG